MFGWIFESQAPYFLIFEFIWGLEVALKAGGESLALLIGEVSNKDPADFAVHQKVQKLFIFTFIGKLFKNANDFLNIGVLASQ